MIVREVKLGKDLWLGRRCVGVVKGEFMPRNRYMRSIISECRKASFPIPQYSVEAGFETMADE